MSVLQAKAPAVVVCSCLCLLIGIGLGIGAMVALGYHWEPRPPRDDSKVTKGPDAGKEKGKGKDKGKGKGGPGPKLELMALLTKLDLLTGKHVVLELTAEQKQKIAQQLKGLETQDTVSDDEAEERLNALLAVLKGQEEPLAAVGFHPPQGAPMGLLAKSPNPFKHGPAGASLKALQERLSK
jgi:hypothetical protein